MPYSVLIVDNDPQVRDMLSQMLELDSFVVDVASDGRDALARLDHNLPDLVLLDVMMPTMSGIEVCQRLRERKSTARLPVVMLSAKTHYRAREEGFAAGANEYLCKPMTFDTLRRSLRDVLASLS